MAVDLSSAQQGAFMFNDNGKKKMAVINGREINQSCTWGNHIGVHIKLILMCWLMTRVFQRRHRKES